MESREIKAIIFDLGRVLIDVDFKRGLFRYVNGDNARDDNALLEQLFSDPLFVQFGTGRIKPTDFYQQIQKRINQQISFDQFKAAWCDIFSPIPGINQLVADLSGNYQLGLLSDTDVLHWTFVKNKYDVLNYFKNPVLSFEIGTLKPHPNCYQLAAKSVDTAPGNCLFLDDREKNVEGARKAGMRAIQVSGLKKLQKDLRELKVL
jgi:putative hydrolase of the HAD superfamily